MAAALDREVIARPTNHFAWLTLRGGFSNGSSAAVHVREHEYESIGDWFVEKRTGATKDETRAMTRGKALEGAIRDWFLAEHPYLGPASPLDVMFRVGRLLVTPDSELLGRNEGIEVKASPGKTGQRSRYWQCVAALAATDWDGIYLVELIPGDYRATYISREEAAADIDRLLAAVDEDWSWVDLGLPPPDAVFDADQVFKLWPQPSIAKIDLPHAASVAAGDLADARARKKVAEADEKAARDVIADAMRDCVLGMANGEPLVSFKANKPSQVFDSKTFKREQPAMAAKYTDEKPGARVMRVVGEAPAETGIDQF